MYIPLLNIALILGSVLSVSNASQVVASQEPFIKDSTNSTCDCSNTNSTGPPTDPPSICNDIRLGPVELPHRLPLLSFVSDYDRFGGETPGEFLTKWTNKTTGEWLWPDNDGYSVNTEGKAIVGNMTLQVGTVVDRFGGEYGRFVSAADAPYNQRSLPPSSLYTGDNKTHYPYGYHVYAVTKPLVVEGGPIAPWFGQPGLGAQFYVGGSNGTNVLQLIEGGYLERLRKSHVKPGAGEGGGCGL
ncbi:MAG: hypothetical protein M1828_000708 [Chrysothrix sp. TS-e1954]|nr:MAG: hypothetical protein M1828_000708 [Chrysothrix sp. TS-e1954]